jgi:shikimate dehydrogenase
MKEYGLIGFPLTHSFSQRYFTEKFAKENIADSRYQLFELPNIADFPLLVKNTKGLCGLNVTIPHKQAVLAYIDELDEVAAKIGAINVIKVLANGKLKGYNSDYYGFLLSLQNFLHKENAEKNLTTQNLQALVLGNGGAAQAVKVALQTLQIPYLVVSQRADKQNTETVDYEQVAKLLPTHQLVINTTPLGMYPHIETAPLLPYPTFTPQHYVFDLVYNPATTTFMQKAAEYGAKVQNGLEMLHLQAEKAWEIWRG